MHVPPLCHAHLGNRHFSDVPRVSINAEAQKGDGSKDVSGGCGGQRAELATHATTHIMELPTVQSLLLTIGALLSSG